MKNIEAQIIMVSSELYPYYSTGGLGIAVYRLLNQLVLLNIRVIVLIPKDIEAPRFLYNKLVYIHKLPVSFCKAEESKQERDKFLKQFFLAVLNYVKAYQGLKPLIILHDNETALCVEILKVAKIKYPILYWMHSLYDYPKISNISIMAKAIQLADWVVVSSGVFKDALELQWPRRLNDIQKMLLQKKANNQILLLNALGCIEQPSGNEINMKTNVNVKTDLLFSGRATYTKGIGFIKELSSVLKKKGVTIRITGNPLPELANIENIKWLGWLDFDSLYNERKNSLFTVSLGITEGFGLNCAESLIQNCEVISFPIGGINDLINFKNLETISLSIHERELFYEFWAELIDSLDKSPLIWEKHKHKFDIIQEKLYDLIIKVSSLNKKENLPYKIQDIKSWGKEVSSLLCQN